MSGETLYTITFLGSDILKKNGLVFQSIVLMLSLMFYLILCVSSYFLITDISKIEFIWWGVTLISILFIGNVFYIEKSRKKVTRRSTLENILELPQWLLILGSSLILFSLFNFDAGTKLSQVGGFPEEIKQGVYVLMNHGSVIGSISESQYLNYKALEIRAWTVIPMTFNLIALLILLSHVNSSTMQNVKK